MFKSIFRRRGTANAAPPIPSAVAAFASAKRPLRDKPAVRLAAPTNYQLGMLGALQSQALYAGTVDPAEIARRRAKNKVARRSRRINRSR